MDVEDPLPEEVERELLEDVERELPEEVDREELLPDEERELLPEEDLDEEDEDLDEEEEDEDLDEEDLDEEESSSRDPQVSLVLSSTRRAERETDGLRELSPGSSMAVSSYGAMKSSMRPPPTGLSPGPAERNGMAQSVAANAVRMYFIVISPVEKVLQTDGRTRQP